MIYTPDTDVIIAGMSVCSEIEAEIYVMTGKGNARRIIDITKVSEKANGSLNKTHCDEQTFLRALLGYPSITGIRCTAGKVEIYRMTACHHAGMFLCSISKEATTKRAYGDDALRHTSTQTIQLINMVGA